MSLPSLSYTQAAYRYDLDEDESLDADAQKVEIEDTWDGYSDGFDLIE